MGWQKPSRKSGRALCAEAGPDDGLDPRLEARKRARAHSHSHPKHRHETWAITTPVDRKAAQLGRQVAETLDAVLAGDSRDGVLRNLRVVDVTPAPDASRLLVTVEPLATESAVDPAEVIAHLRHASGWLRTEVAAAVTRKHAPTLAFRLIAPNTGE